MSDYVGYITYLSHQSYYLPILLSNGSCDILFRSCDIFQRSCDIFYRRSCNILFGCCDFLFKSWDFLFQVVICCLEVVLSYSEVNISCLEVVMSCLENMRLRVFLAFLTNTPSNTRSCLYSFTDLKEMQSREFQVLL